MIQFIFAVGHGWEFSCNGELPFNGHPCQKYDLELFKKYTTGKICVMGRKTFESLPFRLPNRMNVVVSSESDVKARNGDMADAYYNLKQDGRTLKDLLLSLKSSDMDICVIGGARMIEETIEIADGGYITMYDDYYPDANIHINLGKPIKQLQVVDSVKVSLDNRYIYVSELVRI